MSVTYGPACARAQLAAGVRAPPVAEASRARRRPAHRVLSRSVVRSRPRSRAASRLDARIAAARRSRDPSPPPRRAATSSSPRITSSAPRSCRPPSSGRRSRAPRGRTSTGSVAPQLAHERERRRRPRRRPSRATNTPCRFGARASPRCSEHQQRAVEPDREAHARRGRPAERLDQPVVAPAAAERALRAERAVVHLERGARVVVEPAHQRRGRSRSACRARRDPGARRRSARGTRRTANRGCAGSPCATRLVVRLLGVEHAQRVRLEAQLAIAAQPSPCTGASQARSFSPYARPAARVPDAVQSTFGQLEPHASQRSTNSAMISTSAPGSRSRCTPRPTGGTGGSGPSAGGRSGTSAPCTTAGGCAPPAPGRARGRRASRPRCPRAAAPARGRSCPRTVHLLRHDVARLADVRANSSVPRRSACGSRGSRSARAPAARGPRRLPAAAASGSRSRVPRGAWNFIVPASAPTGHR